MNLFCFGLDHSTADVAERERLAFNSAQLRQTLELLSPLLGEMVILSTCNRTEFYIAGRKPAENVLCLLENFFRKTRRLSFPVHYCHEDEDCVRHLFEVAAGLRSMAVGETEIFGQTKKAYETARQHGATGKFLNRLFQNCFSAAKEARAKSGITRGRISVASIAAEMADQIFGELKRGKVLVLGAGEMGEKVARALKQKGAIFVANRTHERALDLAQELGGKALRWEQWPNWMAEADVMIASTAAPHHVLHRHMLESRLNERTGRPLFLIDLAVPRNIDPSLAEFDDVYLYNIDDLQKIAATHLNHRQKEIQKCKNLLHRHEQKFCEWLKFEKPPTASEKETSSSLSTPVPAGVFLRQNFY